MLPIWAPSRPPVARGAQVGRRTCQAPRPCGGPWLARVSGELAPPRERAPPERGKEAGSGPRGTHDGELVISLSFGRVIFPVLGFGLEPGQRVGPDTGATRYVCPSTTIRSRPARRSPAGRGARAGPGLWPARMGACHPARRSDARDPPCPSPSTRAPPPAAACHPHLAPLVHVLSAWLPWYTKRQGPDAPVLARSWPALTAPGLPLAWKVRNRIKPKKGTQSEVDRHSDASGCPTGR